MQSVHQEWTRIRGSWRALHLSPQKEFYTIPGSLAVQKISPVNPGYMIGANLLTILLTSSAEPGSTEQVEFCILDREKCALSEVY